MNSVCHCPVMDGIKKNVWMDLSRTKKVET